MSKIIKQRKYIEQVEYYHLWQELDSGDMAQFIDCDKDGRPLDKNYKKALAEWLAKPQEEFHYAGIIHRTRRYWQPGIIKCDCGKRFDYDDSWLNTCPYCGADYNGNGNRLAPRSQWVLDTGESIADITTGVYNDGWGDW